MNVNTYVSLFFLNILFFTFSYCMQEGSLTFKNTLEYALKIQYQTNITGTYKENAFKDNISTNSSSLNPEDWQKLNPRSSLEGYTCLQVDGKNVWGQTVHVQMYQPHNGQIAKFVVTKVLAYSIIARNKTLLLHNDEQNITVFPQFQN